MCCLHLRSVGHCSLFLYSFKSYFNILFLRLETRTKAEDVFTSYLTPSLQLDLLCPSLKFTSADSGTVFTLGIGQLSCQDQPLLVFLKCWGQRLAALPSLNSTPCPLGGLPRARSTAVWPFDPWLHWSFHCVQVQGTRTSDMWTPTFCSLPCLQNSTHLFRVP